MQVFQAPVEIAGQMGQLSKALHLYGIQAHSYNKEHNYLQYNEAIHNVSEEQIYSHFLEMKEQMDVFHYHYGLNLVEDHRDVAYIQDHKKVRVMQFWGNDVRNEAESSIHNPYARIIDIFLQKEMVDERLTMSARYFPACIVQDFEVAQYVRRHFNRVYVLPLTMDVRGAKAIPPEPKEIPLILHAPTHPYFKGTQLIEEALRDLETEGYRFRYERIHGLSHEEATKIYEHADLIIDQILCGTHGLLAVEAMAMAKPVLAYIRQDLKYRYPADLPILNASPATIRIRLRHFLENPQSWAAIGRQGREYAERYHDLPVVGEALRSIYEREASLLSVNNQEPELIDCKAGDQIRYPIHPQTREISWEGQSIATGVREQKPIETGDYTIIMRPNRMYRTTQSIRKFRSYLSFNMAEVPMGNDIVSASLKLRMRSTPGTIRIHRLRQGWDTKRIRRIKPKAMPKPILKAMISQTKNHRRVQSRTLQCDCTQLAQFWHDNHLKNHGIAIPKIVTGTPELIVVVKRK